MSTSSPALWYVAEGKAELRGGAVSQGVRVRALFSGLSRGTERLVMGGRVPPSEHDRMRCPYQEGAFPFPVKYGYALVGTIVDGARAGETVFALHPHQREIALAADALHAVPSGVPARRAVLTANMETALTAIWDSGVSAGDKVLVIGAGVLGLLIAALATRMPGTQVTVVDPLTERRGIVAALGATFATPDSAPRDQDVVFHASAAPQGLALALESAGIEATVVEASWYGATSVSLALGEAFHQRRLKLVSSQVGSIPAGRQPRWTYARRIGTALSLLADPVFDQFITGEIAFDDAPANVPAALAGTAGLMTVLRY